MTLVDGAAMRGVRVTWLAATTNKEPQVLRGGRPNQQDSHNVALVLRSMRQPPSQTPRGAERGVQEQKKIGACGVSTTRADTNAASVQNRQAIPRPC